MFTSEYFHLELGYIYRRVGTSAKFIAIPLLLTLVAHNGNEVDSKIYS